MGIKTKYEELQKKYNLPSYEDINNDFEISIIEDEKFLLRAIRRKLAEKLDAYSKIIESILMPESNQTSIYECQLFTEDEKKKLYHLFKKVMYFDRFSIETSLNENDEKTANFINEFWKEWPDIKSQLSEMFKELKKGWTKEIKLEEKRSYLG